MVVINRCGNLLFIVMKPECWWNDNKSSGREPYLPLVAVTSGIGSNYRCVRMLSLKLTTITKVIDLPAYSHMGEKR